jgi:ubiquinone/menaquinone biosynthesis C-methylase UbiE
MVDLSQEAFELAKKNFETFNLDIPKMIIADATHTVLDSEDFDCIYNIGLLEHFIHPGEVLKEAYRLLKPGGQIFMPIIPSLPWWSFFPTRIIFNPLSAVRLIVKRMLGRKTDEPEMIRTDYSAKYYSDLAISIGFNKVECMPYNPYPMVGDSLVFINRRVLPIYKWYYATFKKNKKICFKTIQLFQSAYLLIGEKE